jgi:DNA polymerase III alpha subunit
VKLDLLSNRSLSCLEDGDTATVELLARGDTLAISQLETPGMRKLLRQCRPAPWRDLAQALALARPRGGNRETYLRRRRQEKFDGATCGLRAEEQRGPR